MSTQYGLVHTSHRFVWSSELRLRIKQFAYKGPLLDTRGIVEENDAIMRDECFTLPDGSLQHVPRVVTEIISDESSNAAADVKYETTEICVTCADTLSAALYLNSACALNFANASVPGGRYRCNSRAQEEDLCRHLPQLYTSLAEANYPIQPGTALVTKNVLLVRSIGSYTLCRSQGSVTIISAAMPCGAADRRPVGGWRGSSWDRDVTRRIRAVLYAAKSTGEPNLVLGAFGCGAFGNPAAPVAEIFREQLCTPAFRGAFKKIVFAIIDPVGTGNFKPFLSEMIKIKDM